MMDRVIWKYCESNNDTPQIKWKYGAVKSRSKGIFEWMQTWLLPQIPILRLPNHTITL